MYDEFFRDFMSYKGKIPTYGCIMLNSTCEDATGLQLEGHELGVSQRQA